MAIGHFAPKSNPFNRLSAFFQKALVQQRMNSWLGYVILWGIAVFLGYLMAEETVLGLGVAGLLVAITVAVICISNAEAGLYICIAYSLYISYFSRLLFNDELQVGIFSDL